MGGKLSSPAELLGEGAFGKVYKQQIDGTTCAVKKVTDFSGDAVKEVEVMAKLDHENIIKLRGHYMEEAGPYLCLVMEFADEGTFTSFTNKKVELEAKDPTLTVYFREYSIWRGVAHLAKALEYLHTLHPEPILHRDMKPDNILGVSVTTSTGETGIRWKLADFGLAKLLSPDSQGAFYTSTIVGTPVYMAPEVWEDYTSYDFKADIWSLGCVVAFQCNRGKHLFSSPAEVIRGLQPGAIKGGYSRDLVGLIGRMLSPDPRDRPSAGEVVRESTDERQGI